MSSQPRTVSRPSHTPPSHSAVAPQQPVAKPSVYFVPRNHRQILDLSLQSKTPESKVKSAILCNQPNHNAVALVGMGGVGKTTILRAIGRDDDVCTKFTEGIWFLQLSHDATLSSFFNKLRQLVKKAFPDFVEDFNHMTAVCDTHANMVEELIERLSDKRFLLIFDDVWDLDDSVYKLVNMFTTAVQQIDGTSFKTLTSTRNKEVARVPAHDISISISPEDSRFEISLQILCSYARIDTSSVSSLSPRNRDALDRIIELCAGLPLALSVSGSTIQDVIDSSSDLSDQNAIAQYYEYLRTNTTQLSQAESGGRHEGLMVALQSSLTILERKWGEKDISVANMFRSFCILEKQMCLPLSIIEKLWAVTPAIVLDGVIILSRYNVVSLVWDERKEIVGIRLHDLVLDLSVEMAESEQGVRAWHARLAEPYILSNNACMHSANETEHDNTSGGWWQLDKDDKYVSFNLVRHLLGAGRISEALKLLTDYRWIQSANDDKERPPFHKIITEMQQVRTYLYNNEKTATGKRLLADINVVIQTMELCMVPHCIKNRRECTFQLYGRLHSLQSDSYIVQRILWSIELYGRRPWVRAGPGVLSSEKSSLKRSLPIKDRAVFVARGARRDDIIVGGDEGKLWVMNARDGSKTCSLDGHHKHSRVVAVSVDRCKGITYSCDDFGTVICWEENRQVQRLQFDVLREHDRVECMQILVDHQLVLLGTCAGRILASDIRSGDSVKIVQGHTRRISSLVAGPSGNVVVSASEDCTLRLWHSRTFDLIGNVLQGHQSVVTCVVLSQDENLIASGSQDGSVRFWDVKHCRQIWISPAAHRSTVGCLAFTSDDRLLYSGHWDGTICVWRVTSCGDNISLVHTMGHASLYMLCSICVGDNDSEVFTLRAFSRHVFVWDAKAEKRDYNQDSVSGVAFLHDLRLFAISEDEETMVAYKDTQRCVEVHKVSNVAKGSNCVIARYEVPHNHRMAQIVVANNTTMAYSIVDSCKVYFVNTCNATTVQCCSELQHWASSTRSPWCNIETLCFNSDSIGNLWLTAGAIASDYWIDSEEKRKFLSWNVFSNMPHMKPSLRTEMLESEQSYRSTPRAVDTEKVRLLSRARKIFPYRSQRCRTICLQQESSSLVIATMEHELDSAQYCFNTKRLWTSLDSRGLEYVDLITHDTILPPRDEPPLPSLSQHHPPPSQNTTDHTTTAPIPNHTAEEQVYDVFISHAGTDKFTIAEPLYHLLVALGFKVFLDKAELRPGQNASQKMINAMKTAKIAVVILSPEFAARMWTLKELMCFLERFREKGERGVIIIPVFYRLTLEDCRDERTLFRVKGEDGRDVFATEGFLEWMAQQDELRMKNVLEGFQSLRRVTGIENKRGVTNGMSVEEGEKREEFVREIASAIVEAKERLDSDTAAGVPTVAHAADNHIPSL